MLGKIEGRRRRGRERVGWLAFPPPGDLPDSGIEPMSPELAGRFFTTGPPGKPLCIHRYVKIYDNFQDDYGIIIKEVRRLELYF